MHQPIPSWFAADHVFQRSDGWYVGSQNAFSVGPYPDEVVANLRSKAMCERLESARTMKDVVAVVRACLSSEVLRTPRGLRTRLGEEPRVWHRSHRIFNSNGLWFIATREKIDVGPYVSLADAEREARKLILILKATKTEAATRLAIYEFMNKPSSGGRVRRTVQR